MASARFVAQLTKRLKEYISYQILVHHICMDIAQKDTIAKQSESSQQSFHQQFQ